MRSPSASTVLNVAGGTRPAPAVHLAPHDFITALNGGAPDMRMFRDHCQIADVRVAVDLPQNLPDPASRSSTDPPAGVLSGFNATVP